MLTSAIARLYREAVHRIESIPGVSASRPGLATGPDSMESLPVLFETDAGTFLHQEELRHEVFGPATVLVRCRSAAQMLEVARHIEGSLTATIHGTVQDLRESRALVSVLSRKAGRLVFNGYPTGVEVCASMQHGGPYPATTDPRFTSVGTAAIQRFCRPICFQDFSPEFLPVELQGE